MPNDYFRFMRFTVRQDRTPMKVGTDGVLLGAWCGVEGVSRALDVGTGTGLIALMIAQRCGAKIDAIEIDDDAFTQARENISASPWADRIIAHHSPFQKFVLTADAPYDLIVTNPPYFMNSLLPGSKGRTLARHSDSLPLDDLFPCAAGILSPKGRIALIIPYDSTRRAIETAGYSGLHLSRRRDVRALPDRSFFRSLIEFSAESNHFTEEDPLTIECDSEEKYTDDYLALTDEFYLFGRNAKH